MEEMKIAKAYLRYVRIAPRKVQIVCDLIRGKDAGTAMANASTMVLKNGFVGGPGEPGAAPPPHPPAHKGEQQHDAHNGRHQGLEPLEQPPSRLLLRHCSPHAPPPLRAVRVTPGLPSR